MRMHDEDGGTLSLKVSCHAWNRTMVVLDERALRRGIGRMGGVLKAFEDHA